MFDEIAWYIHIVVIVVNGNVAVLFRSFNFYNTGPHKKKNILFLDY